MKKKIVLTFIIGSIVILFFVSVIWFLVSNPIRINYRNFSNIQDFDALNSFILEDELTDGKIQALIPESSFVHYVKYNGKDFRVFAYVFQNQEETICYFKNCTGKSQTVESNFSFSSNGFRSSFIAFQNCCVYRVEGGSPRSVIEFVEYVSLLFDEA